MPCFKSTGKIISSWVSEPLVPFFQNPFFFTHHAYDTLTALHQCVLPHRIILNRVIFWDEIYHAWLVNKTLTPHPVNFYFTNTTFITIIQIRFYVMAMCGSSFAQKMSSTHFAILYSIAALLWRETSLNIRTTSHFELVKPFCFVLRLVDYLLLSCILTTAWSSWSSVRGNVALQELRG